MLARPVRGRFKVNEKLETSLDDLWNRLLRSDDQKLYWRFAFKFLVDYTYALHKDRFYSKTEYEKYILSQYHLAMGDEGRPTNWEK